MIHSMTSFARHEVKADWGNAVWEIRSVNQRYLETYFRLPEQFRGLGKHAAPTSCVKACNAAKSK